MTLLTVINSVADVVGLDQFDSVYGNADPSAQTMVELAQQAGGEISRRVDWQNLFMRQTLGGDGSVLPSDYQRMIAGGVRTADGTYVRPVLNNGQWALLKQLPSSQPYYIIGANRIYFSPGTASVSAVIEYVSKYWVIANSGTRKESLSADDDTTAFPERLLKKNVLWRWKRQQGVPYDDILAEFEADLQQEINADRGVM